ncbi:hypothetical protein NP493_556g00062 [Ridgeia piscesae]|uniref:ERCC4 domain-containing protein n=1 Tax=Ridgeia piscesae TaxID=27915 RepID=A0AAD9NRL8_RIDPI|nr:hypothetical protein NP493_556g00062 [Ridgeia piscesae]
MVNPEKHNGDNSMGGHRNEMHQSERSNQVVQCISSDDDLSVDCHADAESVTGHHAVDSVYSYNHGKSNSLVIGSHLSHCNGSSKLTDACDDLPDLNVDNGPCLSHVDSQTSTMSTITSQSQASVFSSDSVPTTFGSDHDSQASEFSTTGCGRKLTKTSRNAKTVQKEEREKVRQRKMEEQEERRRVKEEERALKQQKREELQRAKAFEKSKKQAQQAAIRQVKPGECLKFMTVVIDPAVLKTPGGSTVLDILQKAEVKYEIVAQPLPNIVTFWREVTKVTETEPQQLHSHTQDVVESQILLVLPLTDFIELVHASQTVRRGLASDDVDTLTTYIQRARDLLEGRQVTLLIQRLEGYFRDQKTREDRAFRGLVLGNQGGQKSKGQKVVLPDVTRLDVEEVLLDLQMRCQCNVKLLETDAELGKMILHYTRAVAETPFKKDRLKTCFSFHIDKKGCVKVDKEGQGLATVWRQQLQQFKNVSADMANAIVAEYPSPWLLYQAYKMCPTEKCAEELLQDILVRRGAGVLSTSRRIGKELSRRVHQLLTATDPNLVIS